MTTWMNRRVSPSLATRVPWGERLYPGIGDELLNVMSNLTQVTEHPGKIRLS